MNILIERLQVLWALRRQLANQVVELRCLPTGLRGFYLRCWWHALRLGDSAVFLAPASPRQTALLLALGRDVERVVELGTGAGMTAAALVLAEPHRRVISYDLEAWPQQARHLALLGSDVRSRIEIRHRPAESGPNSEDAPVGLLFVDSSHEEEETVASFRAWEPALAPGALAIFHDYTNSEFPGVRMAVERLELGGQVQEGMFIWRREPTARNTERGSAPRSAQSSTPALERGKPRP